MTIEDRVKKLISEHLGVALDEIAPDKRFDEDLGADSLDMVELVMGFEEEFGIEEIPDADRDRIRTVADALKYVENAPKTEAANV